MRPKSFDYDLHTAYLASLEGHFDAPTFPLTGFEQKEPTPLEDLAMGPSFVVDFSAHMNEIVNVHATDMDVS